MIKYFAMPAVLLLIQDIAMADTAEEILTAAQEEQEAFRDGDCDKVESMISKDVTFYANGRKMSYEQIGNFCRSVPRPFGAGRSPIDDRTTPYIINNELGYTVRDFRWHDKNERVIHEVVTKIWANSEQGWRIIHFQSTVVPVNGNGRRP